MRLAMLQWELKLQECINMGITIIKIFIWGGISSDMEVYPRIYIQKSKLNFQPYIGQYTFQNENFEYNYPLTYSINKAIAHAYLIRHLIG